MEVASSFSVTGSSSESSAALDGFDHRGRQAPRSQYCISEYPGLRAYSEGPGHPALER